MIRREILEEAARLVTQDRAATHGDAHANLTAIAGHWTWWLGDRLSAPLTPLDVCEMMEGLKQARRMQNPALADNYIDGAGYLALGAEIATGGKQ